MEQTVGGFVRQWYPAEVPAFEARWRGLLESAAGVELAELVGEGAARLGLAAGLGFNGEDAAPLMSPFVVLATYALLVELQTRGFCPRQEVLEEILRRNGQACGAPKALADQLAAELAPRLLRSFEALEPSSLDQLLGKRRVSESDHPTAVVQSLGDGVLSSPERLALQQAASRVAKALDGGAYSLVIDELELTLHVRGLVRVSKKPILPIRRMQRGMLWLALTHVGGEVRYREIGEWFGFIASDDYRRVYQYKMALGKLVGLRLRGKVLAEGVAHTYRVPKEGWSFLWVRRHPDLRESALITDVVDRQNERKGAHTLRRA
jgi:hypothetical protein